MIVNLMITLQVIHFYISCSSSAYSLISGAILFIYGAGLLSRCIFLYFRTFFIFSSSTVSVFLCFSTYFFSSYSKFLTNYLYKNDSLLSKLKSFSNTVNEVTTLYAADHLNCETYLSLCLSKERK